MCVVMLGNRRRLVRAVGLAWGAVGLGSVVLGVVSSPAVAAVGMWSTPVDLSADGYAADTQVSVNASGTAVAVWRGYDGSDFIVQSVSSTDGGVNWSPTVSNLSAAGGNAELAQISVDAAGTAVAVWRRSNGTNFIVQSASSTDGGVNWSPTVNNLSAAGADAFGPQISVNAAGTAVAVWNRYDGSNFIVQSASSTDGGVSWSTPEDLSAAGVIAQNPQISVDSTGTAIAVWNGWNAGTDCDACPRSRRERHNPGQYGRGRFCTTDRRDESSQGGLFQTQHRCGSGEEADPSGGTSDHARWSPPGRDGDAQCGVGRAAEPAAPDRLRRRPQSVRRLAHRVWP